LYGDTGYLFSPDDPNEAKEYILELARDAERARSMGAWASQIARARYDLANVARRYIELYQSLCRSESSRAGEMR
jgi:glycosyltransferase involved in cell wall biosynthesis